MMNEKISVKININGVITSGFVEPRQHLVDFLRDECALKGPHLGCEQGACGACTVMLNGQIVRGCLVLTIQADQKEIQTIEGLTKSGAIKDLQDAFLKHNAFQCGFCTSGMLLTAAELLKVNPTASREEVREWISGNYCRCTGYHAIVDAICSVISARQIAD